MKPLHHQPRKRRSKQASVRPSRATINVWVAVAFLVLCFFLGGSSRFDLLPHLSLRLLSILVIAFSLWRDTAASRTQARPFVLATGSLALLMALQLVPLPPELWSILPGHGFYNDALHSVGLGDRWRPLSMSPDLTINSLLSLLPVMAAAMIFPSLDDHGRRVILNVVLGLILISVATAALQLVSGGFYPYPRNNEGTGVGFFANRNHQALFLAVGIVLIIARWQLAERPNMPKAMGFAALCAAALLPFLVITGSRAGLVAGLLAFLAGGMVFARATFARQARWAKAVIVAVVIAIPTLTFVIGLLTTRQVAVQRLITTGETLGTTELRTANLPALINTIRNFFPFGSGFGTFDAVFRRFESDALLRPTYFNHAHSEPIEILIEGGLPAAVLAAAGLIWIVRRTPILFVAPTSRSMVSIRAQAGLLGLFLFILGSLVDYPLRTPFLAVIAVLFSSWVAERAAR